MNYRALFVLFAVVSMLGCSDSGSYAPETTAAVFNRAGAPTVEFSVPDMMCPEGCAPVVEETLAKQPGALDVLVDFEAKTATVAIDKDKFDSDAAIAALVDKQFANSSLKDIATSKPPLGSELGAEGQAADAPVVQ